MTLLIPGRRSTRTDAQSWSHSRRWRSSGLIRRHAPEWASEIDFATLREEPSGLVSRKTLQRRHPDMIWSAGAGTASSGGAGRPGTIRRRPT
ncbi:MAG: hypothetical protein OXQ94_05610 [Gemmatimonadota bacterium]|nr:hypothetical protein [Gemmatimonadota bacterium]MDE2871148.1 hypothetical protein [Gemmatimonadota bacterium]